MEPMDTRSTATATPITVRFAFFCFLFFIYFFIFTLSSTPLSFVSSRSSFLRSLFFLQLFLFFSLFSCDREIDEEEQDDTKNQPLRRKGRGGGEHVA